MFANILHQKPVCLSDKCYVYQQLEFLFVLLPFCESFIEMAILNFNLIFQASALYVKFNIHIINVWKEKKNVTRLCRQ